MIRNYTSLLLGLSLLTATSLHAGLIDESLPKSLWQQGVVHGLIGMASFGTASWLTGEMLYDEPHRWLFCKQAAKEYAQELATFSPAFLSAAEVKAGTIMQASSYAPTTFWREIACIPLIGLLTYISVKELKKCADSLI